MALAGKQIAAAWSVLTVLVFSQSISAAQSSFTARTLVLSASDSQELDRRFSVVPQVEYFNGHKIYTKRFSSTDGAVRFDCAQTPDVKLTACAITLDPAKVQFGVTQVRQGYVPNSYIFKLLKKPDVQFIVDKMIGQSGAVYSNELVQVVDQQGRKTGVARFRFDCPRDWVFDVVACDGHIILR